MNFRFSMICELGSDPRIWVQETKTLSKNLLSKNYLKSFWKIYIKF